MTIFGKDEFRTARQASGRENICLAYTTSFIRKLGNIVRSVIDCRVKIIVFLGLLFPSCYHHEFSAEMAHVFWSCFGLLFQARAVDRLRRVRRVAICERCGRCSAPQNRPCPS